MNRGYKSFYKDYWGIDLINKKVDIKLDIPSQGWQDLIDDFKEYKKVEVHLSGGMDSQFLCLMMKRFDIPFHATTFRYNNNLNEHEVNEAKKFTKEHDIKHYIKDFNIIDFFDSGEFEIFADYVQCSSPQYSVFFKNQKETNADVILCDGHPPCILSDSIDEAHNDNEEECTQWIGNKTYPALVYGTDNDTNSQLRFAEKIKQPIISNLALYSPQIFIESCQRVQQEQINFRKENKKDWLWYVSKDKIYKAAYDLQIPYLESKTGFEKVKKYYKKKYNKSFNDLFRKPLEKRHPNRNIDTTIGNLVNDL